LASKSNLNVASSDKFSGDRSIAECGTDIRQAKPWPVR